VAPQAAILVEEGGADLAVVDRWGATPAQEAELAHAADLATYLSLSSAAVEAAAAGALQRALK